MIEETLLKEMSENVNKTSEKDF